MPSKNTKTEPQNKWLYALKVIVGLTVLSFFVSIFISFFIGDGLETLDGNVALIEITGPIVAEKGTYLLLEEGTSSEEVIGWIKKAQNQSSHIQDKQPGRKRCCF